MAASPTLLLAAVRLWFGDYYDLDAAWRSASEQHALLRPQGALGLACGAGAVLLGLLLVHADRHGATGLRSVGRNGWAGGAEAPPATRHSLSLPAYRAGGG